MRFGVSPSGAVRPCFPASSLEINEVANLHAKSLCDAVKHACADVGFSKLDSRYVGLASELAIMRASLSCDSSCSKRSLRIFIPSFYK